MYYRYFWTFSTNCFFSLSTPIGGTGHGRFFKKCSSDCATAADFLLSVFCIFHSRKWEASSARKAKLSSASETRWVQTHFLSSCGTEIFQCRLGSLIGFARVKPNRQALTRFCQSEQYLKPQFYSVPVAIPLATTLPDPHRTCLQVLTSVFQSFSAVFSFSEKVVKWNFSPLKRDPSPISSACSLNI